MGRLTFVAGIFAILRWLYGLFFLTIGALVAWHVARDAPAPFVQPTPVAEAFISALAAAPFFDPMLGASYIAGGAALLLPRTIPLGLVLLAPSVAVILLFHLMLSGQTSVGVATAAIWAVLAVRHIRGLMPLWRYGA